MCATTARGDTARDTGKLFGENLKRRIINAHYDGLRVIDGDLTDAGMRDTRNTVPARFLTRR